LPIKVPRRSSPISDQSHLRAKEKLGNDRQRISSISSFIKRKKSLKKRRSIKSTPKKKKKKGRGAGPANESRRRTDRNENFGPAPIGRLPLVGQRPMSAANGTRAAPAGEPILSREPTPLGRPQCRRAAGRLQCRSTGSFYRIVPSFTEFHRLGSVCTGLGRLVLGFYRLVPVLPGFYRLERIGQGCIELE